VAESNTVERPRPPRNLKPSYGPSPKGIGWRYAAPSEVPRQIQEVLVEPWLRDALIRLNPEIAAQPDRADEVLYKLRAIVLSVRSDGLIRANEEMTAWLRGERSMPFGANNEHVPVRLIDLETRSRTSTSSPSSSPTAQGPPSAGPIWCCWSTVCRWC
jgi:type I restriction enzyme R subunit